MSLYLQNLQFIPYHFILNEYSVIQFVFLTIFGLVAAFWRGTLLHLHVVVLLNR